jgi:hypothetical protein
MPVQELKAILATKLSEFGKLSNNVDRVGLNDFFAQRWNVYNPISYLSAIESVQNSHQDQKEIDSFLNKFGNTKYKIEMKLKEILAQDIEFKIHSLNALPRSNNLVNVFNHHKDIVTFLSRSNSEFKASDIQALEKITAELNFGNSVLEFSSYDWTLVYPSFQPLLYFLMNMDLIYNPSKYLYCFENWRRQEIKRFLSRNI